MAPRDAPRIRIGASACLLGEPVRWDGAHRRLPWLVEVLGPRVDLVPVCPEVEIGLGIPRPTIRLEDAGDGDVHLVEPRARTDLSARMRRYAAARVRALARGGLDGYLLKARSPSCGLGSAEVVRPDGTDARRGGTGLFAAALAERLPRLPVVEEDGLADDAARDAFLVRAAAHARLRAMFTGRWGIGDLVEFHAREKLLLMAHRPATYRALGRVVAEAKGRPRAVVAEAFVGPFLDAVAAPPTRARSVNALQHAAGFFRRCPDEATRRAVRDAVEAFARGDAPLDPVRALLRGEAERHGFRWLAEQTWLAAGPLEGARAAGDARGRG